MVEEAAQLLQVVYEQPTDTGETIKGVIVGYIIAEDGETIVAHTTDSFNSVTAFRVDERTETIVILQPSKANNRFETTQGDIISTGRLS